MNVELLCPVLEESSSSSGIGFSIISCEHQELNQFTALHVSWENGLSLVNLNGIDRVEINIEIEKFSEDQI
jgi:hypothetical protein